MEFILVCRECNEYFAVTKENLLDPDFYLDRFDRPCLAAMVRCPHCHYIHSLEATLAYTENFEIC